MIATIKKILSVLKALTRVTVAITILVAVIFATVMAMLAAIPFWAECIDMGLLPYFNAVPNPWQGALYTIYTFMGYFTMTQIGEKL